MKIYLKEEKLPLIKESQDEVTFYGFFTQVKNFMKELLKGNVTAEPSQELKSHGLGKKELISKLKKKGLLKSEENIDEVPNEDDETKLRARHTITYSVPRRDFEKKFHRLYSEIFESEWKSKPLSEEKEMQMCPNIIGVVAGTGPIGQGTCERFADIVNQNKDKHFGVLKNEKEEIQKILDNDTDGAYHKRGGYKIQENQNDEISSQFIQDRLRSTFKRNKDGYTWDAEKGDYVDIPKDKRINKFRNIAVDKFADEKKYSGIDISNYKNDDDAWVEANKNEEIFFLDDEYKSLEDLYDGVKSGDLLIHCRRMIGREAEDYIYPEVGETVKQTYGADYADANCEIEPLVFASSDFTWANGESSQTRNGVYFVKSDLFMRYLGDEYCQSPNGEISRYCPEGITVEHGDWFSDEPAEVVAVLRKKRNFRKKKVNETKNLQESLNNQDAPLYHYTTLDNFFDIINGDDNGSIHSTYNDGDECICFTRSTEMNISQSFARPTNVRLKLDVSKLNIPRNCTTKSYQAGGYDDEFEERIIRKGRRRRFNITNIKGALIGLDILLSNNYGDILDWNYWLHDIEKLFGKNNPIVRFFINEDDFIYNKKKESYDLITTKQYLKDFLTKPKYDNTKPNKYTNSIYANELDRQEEEREKERKHIKEGYKIASLIKQVIINYYNNEKDMFNQPREDKIKQTLWILNDWYGVDKIMHFLTNLNDEDALRLYKYSYSYMPENWDTNRKIIVMLNTVGQLAAETITENKKHLIEGHHNEDYMLYNYAGINKLESLLTRNELESRNWDGDECICLTRNKRYIVSDTTPKIARLVIDPQLIPISKNIKLRPFQVRGHEKESEERIYSVDKQEFVLPNADKFITRIDIDAHGYFKTNETAKHYVKRFKKIVQWIKDSAVFYNKVFFQVVRNDFIRGNEKNMLNINEFKEYLNHLEHGNLPQESKSDEELRLDTYYRAQEIDEEEENKGVIEYLSEINNMSYENMLYAWMKSMSLYDKKEAKKDYEVHLKYKDNPIYADYFNLIKKDKTAYDDTNWDYIKDYMINDLFKFDPELVKCLLNYAKDYISIVNNAYALTLRFFFYAICAVGDSFEELLSTEKINELYQLYMSNPTYFNGNKIWERTQDIERYYKNIKNNEETNN